MSELKAVVSVKAWDIRVEREVEYSSPDDLGYDPQVVRDIKALRKASPWGWCSIKVTVAPKGLTREMRLALEGVEYMGACSYQDKADFILHSDYYPQMVEDAKTNCLSRIQDIVKSLDFQSAESDTA